MNKVPGFFVGMPKDLLLAQIDAALEQSFIDFHQRAVDKVRELIEAASSEQVQINLTVHQARGSSGNSRSSSKQSCNTQRAAAPTAASVESRKLHAASLEQQIPPMAFALANGCPESLAGSHIANGCGPSKADPDLVVTGPSHVQQQEDNDVDDQQQQKCEDYDLVSNVKDDMQCDTASPEFVASPNPSVMSEEEEPRHVQHRDPAVDSLDSMTTLFARRPSAASTQDFAALRKELDWQPFSERSSSRLREWFEPYIRLLKFPCKYIGVGIERIEPKDLHFSHLAALKGKRWRSMTLREQVQIIREELVSTSVLINPETDAMKFWDILVMSCLVFTALVLPYEIAFLESEYGPMYVVNHIVDAIFLVDMVMQFFLKVRIEVRHKTRWVRNRKQIASKYLKSWFLVDLLSIVPYDDISNAASSGQPDSGLEHLKIMRLLRTLRLLKLFRMLKASRLVKRWENRNSLPSSRKHLIKCCLLIFVSVHWMACIWGFFGIWEGTNLKCRIALQDSDPLVLASPTASWYVDTDEAKATNDPSAWGGQSWVVVYATTRASSSPIDPCDRLTLYSVSIYWAIMTMTSIGYGDVVPQIFSEYVIACLCMIVSGIVWAYIIGTASSVLSNMYPESTEFEQRLDAFNNMAIDMQIPNKIRLRGREYLRESRYKWSHERNLSVIQSLGFDLQANLSKQSASLYLGSIGLFSRCSELFCADCAAVMVPHFFEPHYVVQLPNDLCVVEKGAIGHAGRVLVPFNHWGEDFIVEKRELRFKAHAVALNYALVVSLNHHQVQVVLSRHPAERLLFARAAVCMAFKGAVRVYLDDLIKPKIPAENKWVHAIINRTLSHKPSSVPSLLLPEDQVDSNSCQASPLASYRALMSLPKNQRICNGHSPEQPFSNHSTWSGDLYTLYTKEPSMPYPIQPSFTPAYTHANGR